MKKYILIIFVPVFLSFCSQKKLDALETFKANIIYYKFGFNNKNTEDITIKTRSLPDSVSFTYTYKTYQTESNKLVVFKDSILYNGLKLQFLGKRNIKLNKSEIEIEKYLYDGDLHVANLYLNKRRGLIMYRNVMYNTVVEYHLNEEMSSVFNQIIADSTFFSKDYKPSYEK